MLTDDLRSPQSRSSRARGRTSSSLPGGSWPWCPSWAPSTWFSRPLAPWAEGRLFPSRCLRRLHATKNLLDRIKVAPAPTVTEPATHLDHWYGERDDGRADTAPLRAVMKLGSSITAGHSGWALGFPRLYV